MIDNSVPVVIADKFLNQQDGKLLGIYRLRPYTTITLQLAADQNKLYDGELSKL